MLVCLACNSLAALQDIPTAIEFIGQNYADDFKKIILYLYVFQVVMCCCDSSLPFPPRLSKPAPMKTINDVVSMLAPRILQEMNASHQYGSDLQVR